MIVVIDFVLADDMLWMLEAQDCSGTTMAVERSGQYAQSPASKPVARSRQCLLEEVGVESRGSRSSLKNRHHMRVMWYHVDHQKMWLWLP